MRYFFHTSTRLAMIVFGILCLVLGLVGLVFPLIPGILFLLLGVYIFSRLSPSIRRWGRRHEVFNGFERRISSLHGHSAGTQIKVIGLLALGTFVIALSATVSMCRRLTGRLVH